MRRREFLAGLSLLPFLPFGCDPRRRPALALATADTESHVAVLNAASGRVRARVATVEGPRSIEAAGGSRAVVAHTEAGAISLLEGLPIRVRRVLHGVAEPRYTAVAPGGRRAYVTDSARGEVRVIDAGCGDKRRDLLRRRRRRDRPRLRAEPDPAGGRRRRNSRHVAPFAADCGL